MSDSTISRIGFPDLDQARRWAAEVFEATGHTLGQEVGQQDGVVDRFATPEGALSGGRIYWRLAEETPASLQAVRDKLDQDRIRTGASRAILLVANGPVVGEYDPTDDASVIMSVRRFVLDAMGLLPSIRRHSERREGAHIARHLLVDGEPTEAISFISSFCEQATDPFQLRIIDRHGRTGPLLAGVQAQIAKQLVECKGHCVAISPDEHRNLPHGRTELLTAVGLRAVHLRDRPSRLHGERVSELRIFVTSPSIERREQSLELLPLDQESQSAWLATHLKPNTYQLWRRASDLEPALVSWLGVPDKRAVTAMEAAAQQASGPVNWCATLVHLRRRGRPSLERQSAYEAFVLGNELADRSMTGAVNRLSFEYAVAHHISARFSENDTEALTRHRLPQRWVLAFLAVIDPEAAARATADRRDDIRREIRAEVEQQLDLVLGHQLKRSAGTARALLRQIKKRLPKQLRTDLSSQLDGLDEELDFQRRLALTTSKYHQPPTHLEPVELLPILEGAIAPLAEKSAAIDWSLNVGDSTSFVQAERDALREVIHNLAENALHAAQRTVSEQWVRISAVRRNEQVVVVFENGGPPIRVADRQRIFDPRVTTKKGGDQPLGTGMGLPIAQRYARAMGGAIVLDDAADNPRFTLRLVAVQGETHDPQ